MAMALHLKPQFILRRNPNFITHLFSTSSPSSSNNDDQSNNNNDEQSTNQSPLRSYFSDVKASLKQTPNQSDPSFSFSRSSSQSAPLNEIRRNLAQFRLKSAPEPSPSPTTSTAGRAVSFQELYRKNMARKTEDVNNAGAKTVSLDSIRESLTQLRSKYQNQVPNQGQLFKNREFRDSLNTGRFTGGNSTVVRGGSETTLTPPLSFLTQEKKKEEGDSSVKNDLVKPYTYVELGEKLRKLRPADSKVIGKNWLSFKELNERLVKLREYEFKEMDAKGVLGSRVAFKDLRESLAKLKNDKADVDKRKSPQVKLEILSTLGGTETYLRGDPKEHLVEKYFHPDNMSSAEKLKLELKKIRDEFKLSESDCGSSRVQVAQLTVKIKHLSSVLHKKDKHSRKGLQEMVQRRKKLLRYLRRTDWDSYCFCLDKLGLRDNPDYKN